MIDVPRFLEDVRSFEGVRYHHQGRGRFGIDCIGLVIASLAEQGVKVEARRDYGRSPKGRMLVEEIEASGLVERVDPNAPLQPADVLVFTLENDPQHVGVVLDDTREMIHAAALTGFVRIVPISDLWRSKLTDVYRWR